MRECGGEQAIRRAKGQTGYQNWLSGYELKWGDGQRQFGECWVPEEGQQELYPVKVNFL